jgi:prolyl-tRNA synthetase
MRWTQSLIPTLRKPPEGAEIASHVLMLRAGMVAHVMGGSYAWLPLGLRVLRKAERAVREELDAAGALELGLPALTPLGLWERTGRQDDFAEELIRLVLHRQGRKVRAALAPAHEEVVADLIARHTTSYRQLPLAVYQIQTKFRNEERPRFGLLRTSEYVTADAYTFDTSPEAADKTYDRMRSLYCRILERLGVQFLAAEAEGDPAGADVSHELVVPALNGEHPVAHCAECGYTASLDRAEIGPVGDRPANVPLDPLQEVDTPGATTIGEVSGLLGCQPREMIKTLIYTADGRPVAVLIRGDHEANEAKVRRALGARKVELAPPDMIERVTGAPVGFAGPVGLTEPIPVWADRSVRPMRNAVVGANRADAHLTGVNLDRDFRVHQFADLRTAVDGDPCPRCSSTVAVRRAIEVGHLFKLGTRYSEALGARFVDDREEQHAIVMGAYQLGLGRLVAAAVETSHDERGIVWPVSLAPYEVLVMPLNTADPEIAAAADQLHDELSAAGVDVLLDDRDQRAGVKFYDADLIGVPLRAVLGPRGVKQGKLEIKWRWDSGPDAIDLDGAARQIAQMIHTERANGTRFKTWQLSPREGNTS